MVGAPFAGAGSVRFQPFPRQAAKRARICQREAWRLSILGKSARRRLAKKAPRERRVARASDFWRRRIVEEEDMHV